MSAVCLSVVHAAIIAINDAVDHRVATTTLNCLLNPEAHMSNIIPELSEDYQSTLYDAKQIKKEIAFNKVMLVYCSYFHLLMMGAGCWFVGGDILTGALHVL